MSYSEQFLNPSEAAKRLGVSTKALRLSEQRGLVVPVRTAAGWRTYGPAEMAQAAEIVAVRALGLSLAQVARVLKRGGHFVLSVPTEGYLWYHPYPKDYYRFTRDAFAEVLMDPSLYELLDIQEGNTDGRIDGLVGIGKRR